MADEKPGDTPEPAEIDIEAVDDLPPEEATKLLRGEIEPPRKGTKTDAKPADAVKDEFDVDPKSETVPHGQFHRVNERRKAAEAETTKERQAREAAETRANTAMQRMAELLEASKPAPQQQERAEAPPEPGQEPDAGEDPVGWITWRQQRDRFDAHRAQTFHAQQTEVQQIIGAKQNEYAVVREQFPAIEDARKVVLNGWAREFALQGFRGQALTQKVDKMEADYAIWAHRQNLPIGDVIAQLALARGWQPPADDQSADQQQNGATNGNETPARDANGKFVAAAAQMDKREATKAAAKSLGGGGGPSDGGEITPQMIAEMPEEEFRAFKKKYGDNAMRKAFGVAR